LRAERFQRLLPQLFWGQIEPGIAAIVRQRQHSGEKRGIFNRGHGLREQRIELVELSLGSLVAR